MDYEKKYKEAFERAKALYAKDAPDSLHLESIFPELKDSEDEQHRKWILEYLYDGLRKSDEQSKGQFKAAIAWLEKRGEQILDNSAKTCKDEPNTVVVIPKFRVGDVIRPKGSTAEYTIESISGECYHGKGWGLHISCDDDYELVEQKPAENKGMNLVEEDMTPFQKKVFCIIDTTIEEEQGLKQVCDELLMLAHDEIMEKPAWSEEDESMWAEISDLLWEGYKQSGSKFSWDDIRNWVNPKLKSLKPQNRWKPSDEQMEALKQAKTDACGKPYFNALASLYVNLKGY